MRTEREMLDLILRTAEADERIRAVLLSGSRADPEALKDRYRDYDVAYFVNDIAPFYNNTQWIKEHFGEPLIMQTPETMDLLPPAADGHFTWLMIFPDGNRIDLSVEFVPYRDNGEPVIVLLDKDAGRGLLPAIKGDPKHWHVKPPTEKLFLDCCNEFWWCLNNVAKGVAREELPYAIEMLNLYVRDMLNRMAAWLIGVQTGFSANPGKMGKYFKKHLPPDLYARYAATYPRCGAEEIQAAADVMCDLFHEMARTVAGHFGFAYRQNEEDGSRAYLRMVRENALKDAVSVTLRPAAAEDAEALAAIQQQAFKRLYDIYHDEGSPYLRGAEEILQWLTRPNWKVFQIFADGILVGGIAACERNENPGECYLARVYVLPQMQGRGIASRAVLLCEKHFHNVSRWSLDFPVEQSANRRCYEKAGYRDTGEVRVQSGGKITLALYEKLMLGCTEEEKAAALRLHNQSAQMKGLMVRRGAR